MPLAVRLEAVQQLPEEEEVHRSSAVDLEEVHHLHHLEACHGASPRRRSTALAPHSVAGVVGDNTCLHAVAEEVDDEVPERYQLLDGYRKMELA